MSSMVRRPTLVDTSPAAVVGRALTAILDRLEDVQVGAMVCEACGCLCLPDERCPGCRARREVAA